MKNSKEIKALLHLLDDPDREIFDSVSKKILFYGKDIIPNLESFWEQTTDNTVQERIEDLIHKVNFSDIYHGLEQWFNLDKPNLLDGAILLARYKYPDLEEDQIRKTIKNIYQSCWLELNNYLTPLEQVTIINSIFYSMYKFKGFDLDENKPAHFYMNEVVESHFGNNYSLGILYQVLCEMLDIPVFSVQLPHQFLLAYYDTRYDITLKHNSPFAGIQFYIDPNSGMIYTQNDVDVYLKKYGFTLENDDIYPLSNKEILLCEIEALIQVYNQLQEEDKAKELQTILDLKNNQ